jgi:hypothetical protein
MKVCPRAHIYPATLDRCPRCEQAREQARNVGDPHRQVVRTYRWQKVRKLARARDGNHCQFAGEGECHGQLEVHHLVSAVEHRSISTTSSPSAALITKRSSVDTAESCRPRQLIFLESVDLTPRQFWERFSHA